MKNHRCNVQYRTKIAKLKYKVLKAQIVNS